MEALLVLLVKSMLPIILGWVGLRFDQFVRSKVKNEKLAGLLTRMDDAVGKAVLSVSQTFVDGIDRDKDGKISKAEAGEARKRAVDEAKNQLGPSGWAEWVALLGGENKATEAIGARVEAAVKSAKFLVPGLTRSK